MLSKTRKALAVGGIVVLAAGPVSAVTVEGVNLPPRIEAGDMALSLMGCGTREIFLINVYVVGLYLPRAGLTQREILSPDMPKAVQLHIVYDGNLPQDVPDNWREPLADMASREIQRSIKDLYESFKSGDQVTITYTPQTGTAVMVNGRQVRDSRGDDLMQPLLRLWIGDEAVSANLRQLLLRDTCSADKGWF